VYLWNGSRGLIVINDTKSKKRLRQRFTAAHELGHHELHRRTGEQLVIADENVDEESSDIERYGLSYAALLNRLMHAGCLRGRDRERLINEIEPGAVPALAHAIGLDFDVAFPSGARLPEDYVLAVVHLYKSDVISSERLAALLRMKLKDAISLAEASPKLSVESRDEAQLDALLGI
jgi:hypothetical protein